MTNSPQQPVAPSGPKAWWGRFRSWPKPAQIGTWVLAGVIGIGAVSGGGEKKDTAPARSSGQVATTTTTAPASTSTTVKVTSTTAAPATATTQKVTTTTAKPATATSTAKPTTTTTQAAPTTTTTQATSASYVKAGAFCSPAGADGYTSAGTYMVCKTSPTDDRNRWRAD